MNLSDHTTEQLLRMALTGGDDELDSTARLAMDCVAGDLALACHAMRTEDAADYDFTDVIERIGTRAEIAAELCRRELDAAKQSAAKSSVIVRAPTVEDAGDALPPCNALPGAGERWES